MSNKPQNTILNVINASLLIAGIASLVVGTKEALRASLLPQSGQGALAGYAEPTGELFFAQGVSLHPAATVMPNMGPLLALGMFLILLGCTIHALFVLQKQDPTPVSIKRKVNGKDLHPIRQYLEVFWIDLRK